MYVPGGGHGLRIAPEDHTNKGRYLLSRFIIENDITQYALAERLGVASMTISSILNSPRLPSLELALYLDVYVGIQLRDWFCEYSPDAGEWVLQKHVMTRYENLERLRESEGH